MEYACTHLRVREQNVVAVAGPCFRVAHRAERPAALEFRLVPALPRIEHGRADVVTNAYLAKMPQETLDRHPTETRTEKEQLQ